jgi:DNA-directed RNA polymerase specialized sigma24 family protein
MDRTPERAPEQSRRSVDLDRYGVPLDAFLRDHGDISANEGASYITVNPGRSEAQEMLAALAALAEHSPRAVVVLLLSAVRGKNNRETANIMHSDRRTVKRVRAWLRRHYAALSACCGKS